MIQLRYIIPGEVDGVWAEVSPLMERAASKGIGEHTPATILAMIRKGGAQLWIGQEYGEVIYAVVTHIAQYPTGVRVCEFMAAAGDRVDEWVEIATHIESWARKNGCDACEMIGRPGWKKKLPDYRLRHVRLVKELRYEDQKCA